MPCKHLTNIHTRAIVWTVKKSKERDPSNFRREYFQRESKKDQAETLMQCKLLVTTAKSVADKEQKEQLD